MMHAALDAAREDGMAFVLCFPRQREYLINLVWSRFSQREFDDCISLLSGPNSPLPGAFVYFVTEIDVDLHTWRVRRYAWPFKVFVDHYWLEQYYNRETCE